MTNRRVLIIGGAVSCAALVGGAGLWVGQNPAPDGQFPLSLSESEWRKRLTRAQFRVLRKGGTERAFSSPFHLQTEAGTYGCAGCGQKVYSSEAKFHSPSGWPSFYEAIDGNVGTKSDPTLAGILTEVHCSNCGGHLGHIFDDGPAPTGKRHCINGVALAFTAA